MKYAFAFNKMLIMIIQTMLIIIMSSFGIEHNAFTIFYENITGVINKQDTLELIILDLNDK